MDFNDNDDAMSGLDTILHKVSSPVKEKSPEEKVEEALEKALKNTRPDHAGTPWE